MAAKVTFFPVGCGDMTLIELADNKTRILVDINIRAAADDPDDETFDAASDLRKRLKRDAKGRHYVDAFLLSHPDEDHCKGLRTHFYLGAPEDYPDDDKEDGEKKIVIREIWSSPLVFRRASKNHTLCEDAKAFNTEAKRRVKVNRDKKFRNVAEGDRILVLGEDENGKTDDLEEILVKADGTFTRINGAHNDYFSARLLGPMPKGDEADEELLSKNNSSVILNIQIAADRHTPDGCKYLTAGDAEVVIWERLWDKHKGQTGNLEYDLLLTPHHCSWHSLSYDSWSEKREEAEVSEDARSALSQTRDGAILVASSKAIKDDDNDPPCHAAKGEYSQIAADAGGDFVCVGEHRSEADPEPLEITIAADGPQLPAKRSASSAAVVGLTKAVRQPLPHG